MAFPTIWLEVFSLFTINNLMGPITASFAALGSETAGSNPCHNTWLEKTQGMSTLDTKHCFNQPDHVDEQLYCHKSHSKVCWKHSDTGAGTLFAEDCSLPALWPDLTVQKPKVLGHHKLRCVDCSHSCGRKNGAISASMNPTQENPMAEQSLQAILSLY